jgi:hypothetical protein
LVPLVERSILKPVSPVELSVQVRSIRFDPTGRALSPVGAANGETTLIRNVAESDAPLPSATLNVNLTPRYDKGELGLDGLEVSGK